MFIEIKDSYSSRLGYYTVQSVLCASVSKKQITSLYLEDEGSIFLRNSVHNEKTGTCSHNPETVIESKEINYFGKGI